MAHDHDHSFDVTNRDQRKRLIAVFAITAGIFVVQLIGALVSDSLALLADAGHMLTDAAGLGVAVFASILAGRPATAKRTWGFQRIEVLAATIQAAVLLAVGVFVLIEGFRRLVDPPDVASGAMLVFGTIGLIANLVSMAILLTGKGKSFNMKAATLEVANDALGSVAVLVAALIIATTGWLRADALVSIVIGALIIPRTLKLLRETTEVLLESTPRGLDLDSVRAHLLDVPHVSAVHDLHASQIAAGLPVLTAHVVVEDSCFEDGHAPQILDELQACLVEHFATSIEHSTFQLETQSHADHETSAHH